MDIADVKRLLNTVVSWHDTSYIFAGCILRLNEQGFFYTAELRDMRANHSLVVARLEEVKKQK
ncbi:MAG: hypothetical protein AB9835_14440 [Eubacteriales bacterium]